MSGLLAIVGLGPGAPEWITPEAQSLLAGASDLIGYGPYLDRLTLRADQHRHASDNRVELERARHAIALARAGKQVAVVSGGDPGVFAMASAVFEAMERDGVKDIEVRVAPGVSAMQAAAARLGAPLGHDFCVISLSDNLKPWDVITQRLRAAARADFVIALYNPASKARPQRIFDAFAVLRSLREGATLVAFARAIGRPDERLEISTLATADPARVDMATLVLIGSSATRAFPRADGQFWVYTPRSIGEPA